jgi:hypothetical protein
MIPFTKEFSDHLITWGSYADRFAARSQCLWQINEEFSKATIIGDITSLPVEHKREDQASETMGMLTMPYKCWSSGFLKHSKLLLNNSILTFSIMSIFVGYKCLMFIDLGKKILWTSDPGYGSPNDIIHLRHFKRNY